MPQFSYPIPDVYPMVTRPVILSVIRQIMSGTGIPDDAFIEYKGEHNQVPTWRSFISKKKVQDFNEKTVFIEKVQVDIDENPLDDFILSTPYHYPDNKKVWEDPALGITLSPFYERAEYTVNFTYRTPDKGSATQWRTNMMRRMKVKFSDMSMVAEYNVLIPSLILYFLHTFYRMRESVSGYGDSWDTYFFDHRLQHIINLVDQAGHNQELAFNETQLDILGNFEFTSPPKEERQEDGACYTVQFSYRFRFDHPKGFVLKYPLVIHNQMIPTRLRPPAPHRYDPHAIQGNSSQSLSRYDVIIQDSGVNKQGKVGGHCVPWFDDWAPNKGYHNTTPLLQLLCRVDPAHPTLLVNIGALAKSGLTITEPLATYMMTNHRSLTYHAQCAVFIAVYVGDERLDSSEYHVTEDLSVICHQPLQMREVYHVVVFILHDLFTLTPDAKRTLKWSPAVFKTLVCALNPDIDPNTIPVLADKYISESVYQNLISTVNSASSWYGRPHSLMKPTAFNSLVQQNT